MRFLFSFLVVSLTLLLTMDKACAQKELQSAQDILEHLKSYPQAYELVQQSKLNEAIGELSKYAPDNEGNAIFYYLLGLLQMKQRDHTAAAISLERVVLIEPNNAGAWLDLAIASLESGNIISASSYFDYIEANFPPPPVLQKIIFSYRKRIELRQKADRKWRFTSEAIAGYDSNANSGLQVAVIPVTFGKDRVELTLDPKYQARGDQFTQLLAGSQFHQNYTSFGLDIGMSVKLRNYRAEHNFSSTEFASNIGIQRPSNFGMMSLSASADHNVLASNSLLNNMRINLSLERNNFGCRYGGGMEFELRRYIQLTELNANTTWLQLGGACDLRVWSRPTRAAFILRTGRDSPTANRAGGQTVKQELILQFGTFFTAQWRLDLSLHMSNGQDDTGYSALLENNAPRYLRRNILRAQLSYPVDSDLDLFLRLDDNKIRSNIPLFIQSGKTASFGLQKRF
ncbi:tetratricopeptide repeat protein [Undibacterium sp.]|uniref:tetratricopeptide repeat protein n=1 Tax=Undibacterium sp. TaxID=1914977 RepID=UPI0037525B68